MYVCMRACVRLYLCVCVAGRSSRLASAGAISINIDTGMFALFSFVYVCVCEYVRVCVCVFIRWLVPACVFGMKLAAQSAGHSWGRLVDLLFLSKFHGAAPFVFTASAEACVLRPAKMVSSCVVYIDCSLILTEMYRVGLRGHSGFSLGCRCWFLALFGTFAFVSHVRGPTFL